MSRNIKMICALFAWTHSCKTGVKYLPPDLVMCIASLVLSDERLQEQRRITQKEIRNGQSAMSWDSWRCSTAWRYKTKCHILWILYARAMEFWNMGADDIPITNGDLWSQTVWETVKYNTDVNDVLEPLFFIM